MPGCKRAHPNRVAPEIEQAILDYSLTRPTHGSLRVAQELALQGVKSVQAVVWQRHDLLSKHDRLLRLEKKQLHGLQAEHGIIIPKGIAHIGKHQPQILEVYENGLPVTFRQLLKRLGVTSRRLTGRFKN